MLLSKDELAAFREGSRPVMEKFYKTYYEEIYIYCYKKLDNSGDAEDVTAETLARVWDHRHEIQDPAHLHRCLYKIAKNKSIDRLRRKSRQPTRALGKLEEVIPSEEVDLYDRLDAAVQARLLESVLDEVQKLARVRRKVMYLNLVRSIAIEEVARALNITRKTAYNHRHLGILDLRKALKKKAN